MQRVRVSRLFLDRRAFLPRRMASSRSTHLERTQDSSRSEVLSDVEVKDIVQLSPSVKGYTLAVNNTHLGFKPGQWVDLHIPEEDTVGGYSITSPPHQLHEEGTINLAIQHSDHPPTYWMTTKSQIGDKLRIRVGGDFFYAPPIPKDAHGANLLLIAGGVGINPLISMLQHHIWLLSKVDDHHDNRTRPTGAVQLLYSAKSENELIFKDKLDRLSGGLEQVHTRYFVTQQEEKNSDRSIQEGRISEGDVKKALSLLQPPDMLRCYVCGPPPMLDTMVEILTSEQCRVERDRIHFEKWW